MKLSDINTIKHDLERAETIADIKRSDYFNYADYLKNKEKELINAKNNLKHLNAAIIARRSAYNYQRQQVHLLVTMHNKRQEELNAVVIGILPDGYYNALDIIRSLNSATGDDSAFKSVAIAELIAPYQEYHDKIQKRERLIMELEKLGASAGLYKSLARKHETDKKHDKKQQTDLNKHIANLSTLLVMDTERLPMFKKRYEKSVTVLNNLKAQLSLVAVNIRDDSASADKIIKQMENAARARLGHIHKKQQAIKAQKEKAKRNEWNVATRNTLDSDVFYKHTGTDKRKTLSVPITKGEKHKAPIGCIHKL